MGSLRGVRHAHVMRTGHTLLELTVALVLLTAGSLAMAKAGARYRDRAAVLAARETVVSLLARTRREALASGGASLELEASPAAVVVRTRGARRAGADLDALGVAVQLPGARSRIVVHYGPLGLGRFANTTVTFHRGGATAGLVVSSYGRVVRK